MIRSNASVRKVIREATWVPLGVTIALSLLSVSLVFWVVRRNQAADQSDALISQARLVQRLAIDMESGVRGFLLTGNADYLEPYHQALGRLQEALDQVDASRLDADQRRALAAARTALQGWSERARQAVGSTDGGGKQALESGEEGKLEMDAFRAQMLLLVDRERHTRELRQEEADFANGVVPPALTSVLLVSGVLLALTRRRDAATLLETFEEVLAGLEASRKLELAASSALSRSEASFRDVISSLPDGIVVHRARTVIFCNPAFAALVGQPREALIGASIEQFVPPEDLAVALGRVDAIEAGGAFVPPRDALVQTSAAEYVPTEVESRKVVFGGEAAILSRYRDLRERNSNARRMAQLDRLAAVGTLSAGIAHEINNPLAYIRTNLDFALAELKAVGGGGAPAQVEEVCQALQDSVEGALRIQEIVAEVKGFARADLSSEEFVDVGKALHTALKLAKPVLKDGIEVVRELEPVPMVKASAGRLGQVFLNLIVNACHAMPHDLPRRMLQVRLRSDDGAVRVEVEDSGTGMSGDVLRRLFEPFFTTKPAGVGTGLGLAISREIIEGIGGKLEVRSSVGLGTCFSISLPVLST